MPSWDSWPEPLYVPAEPASDESAGHDAAAERDWRQQHRHASWATMVHALAAAGGSGTRTAELRHWLALAPLSADDLQALEAIAHCTQAEGASAGATPPPPWRSREDWNADGS